MILKNYKIKSNGKIICSYIILILVLFISVGFSAFYNELGIKKILATVRVKVDIRITSVNQSETYDNAYSSNINYNVSNISGTITLPSEYSYVDYVVKIINFGNIEMGINDITLNNDNLEYEILNYTLGEKLCSNIDDVIKCTLGNENDVIIRLKWKDGKYDENNINNNFIVSFDFQNYHKVIVEDTIKDLIVDCPSEILNNSNLTFKYAGEKFDFRIFMNGIRVTNYQKKDNTITIENITGPVNIKYISYDIENGSFETPTLNTTYKFFDADTVPSWNTTTILNEIEFGKIQSNKSEHLNLTADDVVDSQLPNGNQFAEINASEQATLFQTISVTPDVTYNWSLYHRGRSGMETMALIIGNMPQNEPQKINTKTNDQYNVMVDWLFEQKKVDLQVPTKIDKYIIYSVPFNSSGGFDGEDNNLFSYFKDETHTEEWTIWIISSSNARWFNYSDIYVPSSNSITFALCSIVSGKENDLSYGNLIDLVSFKENDEEKIVNGSFEDVEITVPYKLFSSENSTNPTEGIGWSSTSIEKKVEIGNFEYGKNAYGISKDILNYMAYVKDGNNFIELNASETGTIYQNFLTQIGTEKQWSIAHRGRDGIDYIAMIIGKEQDYNPIKPDKSSKDQYMKIVEWIKNNIDLKTYGLDFENEKTGCTNKIKIYSSKFSVNGSFIVADSEAISLTKDEIHTEEWDVWIMGTGNEDWALYGFYDNDRDYDNTYINNNNKYETTIAFTNYSTWGSRNNDSGGEQKGNLLDYILWK